MVTRQDIDRARGRSTKRRCARPTATAARYDRALGAVVVSFGTDLDVAIKAQDIEGLARARPEELERIEISPSGLGLYFPGPKVDLYLPPLLGQFRRSRRRRER
jgi:Protein of unknown function (DUF2442)